MSDKKENLVKTIGMASGQVKADLLIINCQFVDVFNQELVEGPLAIGNGKIVGWGKEYEAQNILDAQGGIVLPGLIDGHVHIESSALTPPQFARCILPFGTTTVIADPHEIANVCGIEGIRYMLQASRNLPLNVKVMLPSCVPATPFEQSGAQLSAEDLETLIGEEGILGLGEVMDYPSVIHHSDSMIEKLLMAQKYNMVIDGHSPDVSGKDLMAYAAAGIMTDHECSTTEAMKERLRMGQYILLREGSSCKDLLNLIPAVTPANARHCVLCTDDREASDILASGHLNHSLRLAVAAGLDPMLAVSIATINAAECFRLKGKGAIAPGYDADLLIVDNLHDFNPKSVLTNGQQIAQDGKLLVGMPEFISEQVCHTVKLTSVSENDLVIPLRSEIIRAIGVMPRSVLTEHLQLKVIKDHAGNFDPKLNKGLNKLAVIERHHATGNIGLGVLANFGVENGAIALSVAHDSHNIVVVGDNDQDMLTAVHEIEKIGGGFVVCQQGKILAKLALPVAGLMSDKSASEVAQILHELIEIIHNKLNLPRTFHPLMTLVFMTLPVIPELKLTSNGLFDVKTFSLVDLCV